MGHFLRKKYFGSCYLSGNTRPGRETSLGWEGRLCRKSKRDRDSKLNRDISLGWESGPSKESMLGRETSF